MDHVTREVIDYFEQINRIPRCSKQERQLAQWLNQWAQKRQLEVNTDTAGNMVVAVPASPGIKDAPVVVLQGHMDMVCEKHADSDHDFAKDPILMVQDGHWLTAKETTLGADNGIALAYILALVDDPEVVHPPLELFFTVEEETGLTGVLNMDPSLLSGRLLINIDSEDEGCFVIGCAGGRNTTIEKRLDRSPLDNNSTPVKVLATGMRGGHSGIDIGKHRANANKVMARLLCSVARAVPLKLVDIEGGSGRNVIPRACAATVACHPEQMDDLKASLASCAEAIKTDYHAADPGLHVEIQVEETMEADCVALGETDTATVLDLLTALPNGPLEMNRSLPHLVQTSVNLSMVAMDGGTLKVTTNQRSSVPDRLDGACGMVEAVGRLAGAQAVTGPGYPPWPANRDAFLLRRCTEVYRQLFESEPEVQIMHAGLECAVIGDLCPGMDMISLGPTIENPHSPSERLYLPSVEKVWHLLAGLLEALTK